MGPNITDTFDIKRTKIITSYVAYNCEASIFDSNSNRTIPIRFESKVTGRFEIFESAAPAVVPQTTLTVELKTSTVAPL